MKGTSKLVENDRLNKEKVEMFEVDRRYHLLLSLQDYLFHSTLVLIIKKSVFFRFSDSTSP